MILPRRLQGGATAILEPIAGTRTVSIGFWFPFGSRHERAGERGYTHFIEHMLFKGTASRSAADIAREIDRLGGYLNAFTEREAVCFHCTLPGEYASTAIDVLTDMLFFSLFPEREFDKEKTVIMNEIMSAEDDPEDISYDNFLKAIWRDNALSLKIAGEAEQVSAILRDALVRFYEERFRLESLLVCVSGAFDPERMIDALEHRMNAVPERRRSSTDDFLSGLCVPAYSKISGYERAGIQQVQLYCGHPISFSKTSRDYNAFTVFNCAFGESMSSRLFQNIREAKGYCYNIFSFFAFADDVGLWCVNGSTARDLFGDLRDAVIGEIRIAAERGMTDKEVMDAVSHLKGSHLIAAEDIEHRMKRLARQYYFNSEVLDMDEGIAELSRITAQDVNAIAQQRISAEDLSVYAYGALGPGRESAGLERMKGK